MIIWLSYVVIVVTGACNFEKGRCTWTNAQTGDDFDWKDGTGSTTSGATGPNSDHTLGNSRGMTLILQSEPII